MRIYFLHGNDKMDSVREPVFKIFYNGKNITADITQYLLSVKYIDKVVGESDEIEILLEDTDGRWRNDWYPAKGDRIKLQMGYKNTVLDCGEFEVDEIELSGPPDTVNIKGLATWVTTPMRTRDSKAHENKTLRQIAQYVCSKHGLTLQGTIATIRFARSTQNRETDLEYLYRISKEFGYVFSVRGTQMFFSSIYELEDGVPVKDIDRTDLTNYNIKDKTSETYNSAVVQYRDPNQNKVVQYEVQTVVNADNVAFNKIVKKDVLKIKTKAENRQQAEFIAKAALHNKNSLQQQLSFSIYGDPLLVAGNNINLTGMGTLSGKYHIVQSTHSDEKSSGYKTDCECKRVGFVQKVFQKTKKRKPRKYTLVSVK